MECKNSCGKDLTGRQLLYCSDKCRMQHKRTAESELDAPQPEQIIPNKPEQTKVEQKSDSVEFEPKVAGVEVRSGIEYISVSRLTAKQLYFGINSYPQDTWKDSIEYKELMRRLHSMSIAELKSGGYDIPCWKYNEAA